MTEVVEAKVVLEQVLVDRVLALWVVEKSRGLYLPVEIPEEFMIRIFCRVAQRDEA